MHTCLSTFTAVRHRGREGSPDRSEIQVSVGPDSFSWSSRDWEDITVPQSPTPVTVACRPQSHLLVARDAGASDLGYP